MSGDTITFAELSEWQRAEVRRHLDQTYGMNYGSQERAEAMVFRLPVGDPATVRTEPPAVLLRELRDAAAAGTAVKAPRMGRPDAARVSELLLQTASRADREARDGQVTEVLGQLWRGWDAAHKVPADEYQRQELVRWNDKPGRAKPAYRGAIK